MSELIQIDYEHKKEYSNIALNAIGATTSNLRIVPTPTGDIAYVRKFGKEASETDCLGMQPIANGGTIKLYSKTTNTLLGTNYYPYPSLPIFTQGSSAPSGEGLYVIVEATDGNIILNTTVDIDFGYTLTVSFPSETILSGETRIFYISNAGSSYYDSNMKYGGARHTPVLNNSKYPYFDITSAINACGIYTDDGVEILDSETYDEELLIDKSITLYATAGQIPFLTRGKGHRIIREVTDVFNNVNSAFFNENGNDSTGDGTWQKPLKTLGQVYTDFSASSILNIIYGGLGAQGNVYFDEDFIAYIDGQNFEPEYGYIFQLNNYIGGSFKIKANGLNCRTIGTTSWCTIQDCTFTGGSGTNDIVLKRNIMYDSTNGFVGVVQTADVIFDDNIFKNHYDKAVELRFYDTFTTGGIRFDNNEFYLNGNAIYCLGPASGNNNISTFSITHNIFYKNSNAGIYLATQAGTTTVSVFLWDYNIMTHNLFAYKMPSDFMINDPLFTYTHFYLNGTDISGNATNDYSQNNNPLYIDEFNLNFSIKKDSGSFRNLGIDGGLDLKLIQLRESNIKIHGLNIYNSSNYSYAIKDSIDIDNFDTFYFEWNNIYNFNSIGILLKVVYTGDNNNNLINNLIHDCGHGGCYFIPSSLNIYYNIIYKNSDFGLALWNDDYVLNHNIIDNCNYAIDIIQSLIDYSITIKNSILSNCSYSIYSLSTIFITQIFNSCLTGLSTANVNINNATNIFVDPFFIDLNDNIEDYHIKVKEDGYIIESPCKDNADDGYDIGAYLINRNIINDSWKKYILEYNPDNIDESLTGKDIVKWMNNFGNINSYANSHKIKLPFNWGNMSVSTKNQMQKIKYFNTLFPTRENNKLSTDCEFRIHLLPQTFYGSGSGVINTTNKTLTDSTNTFIENEKKGWWITIKWTSGTGNGTINSSAKTLTVSGSPFIADDWIGHYFHYSGVYYYILDNSTNVLTLSDPNNYLTNQINIDWYICKYFKITKNTDTGIFTLNDDNNELITGTYNYFIDFILCNISPADFKWKQIGWDYTRDDWKLGYDIQFEEID